MTSTSRERVVLRGLPEDALNQTSRGEDLRTGTWTRLGIGSILGDAVTEATLDTLAEKARAAGHAQGYAAGWAEGRRRAGETSAETAQAAAEALAVERRALADRQAALVEALSGAVEQVHASVRAHHDALAEQAVDLALQIAEQVLGRELAVATDPGREALERAVRAVRTPASVTVRLHPDDAATVDPAALAGRDVTVVADPTLTRGDAVAETDSTVVDATVAGALARVREVLGR